MKKRMIGAAPREGESGQAWLPLDQLAEVEITSESEAHPIEAALLPGAGAGWRANAPGEQTVRLKFAQPRALHRVRLVIEEREHPRTQQFVLRAATAGAWREIARQQFNFSPDGATREQEEYQVELPAVSTLELTIRPDISGGGAHASLRELRVA